MATKRLAKGPIRELFYKFKFFNYARPELYGGSYVKNLAAESPELVGCAAMVLTGFGLLTYAYYDDKATKRMTERPYKHFYTVVRPDDPTIERLRRERPAYYNDEGTLPPAEKPVYQMYAKQ